MDPDDPLELFPDFQPPTPIREPLDAARLVPVERPAGRVVRVQPDVSGIDKTFDYLVPVPWDAPGDARGRLVAVGSRVRIDLHGRRVAAWVLEDNVEPPPEVKLRPLSKASSLGPPAELIDLARWTAWRWHGRFSAVLTTATPPTNVQSLPPSPTNTTPQPPPSDDTVRTPQSQHVADSDLSDATIGYTNGVVRAGDAVVDALFAAAAVSVVRRPPADDVFDIVAAATRRGNTLIIAPSVDDARVIANRLRRGGVPAALHPRDWATGAAGATVVGARTAVFAPVADLAAIVLIDEHAEAHQEERVPTWHARDVVVERARRAGVPCVITSPAPTLHALALAPVIAPSRSIERAGWPVVDIIDRRRDDLAARGLFSDRIVDIIRGPGPVVCVLNRTGRSRLLACGNCGELGRCERCAAAVTQGDDGQLHCVRCHLSRPAVCASCGAQQLKNLRLGVTRAAEELSALAGRPVIDVTAKNELGTRSGSLYIGTEAVLHQVTSARAVVFLDFDQELLAPRSRVSEFAMALLVRAARLVGGRVGGGRVLVQTRQPRHPVLEAALHADPGRLATAEAAVRRELGFPPFAALAMVSGASAEEFINRLGRPDGVAVMGPNEGRWLVRAADPDALANALAEVDRPPGRVRIEVDPPRF